MEKKRKEQIQRSLRWLRQIRNEAYEEWKKDPLGFRKKQKKEVKEFRKRLGLDKEPTQPQAQKAK